MSVFDVPVINIHFLSYFLASLILNSGPHVFLLLKKPSQLLPKVLDTYLNVKHYSLKKKDNISWNNAVNPYFYRLWANHIIPTYKKKTNANFWVCFHRGKSITGHILRRRNGGILLTLCDLTSMQAKKSIELFLQYTVPTYVITMLFWTLLSWQRCKNRWRTFIFKLCYHSNKNSQLIHPFAAPPSE